MMKRTVEPEILDTLAPDDPAADHARRDLRVFNAVMSNWRWLRKILPAIVRPGERVLEIGAGTGELGRALHSQLPTFGGLDRLPRPNGWPDTAPWHEADILQFDGWSNYDIVVANLVLHHFDDAQLHMLGTRIAPHLRLLVACEPSRRHRFQWLFAALCFAIRAHPISRHDGRTSIRAGFRRDELPRALGLTPAAWRWQTRSTGCGAYRLIAEKHI